MNVHFNLVDKSRATASIRIIITHHGKTYRRTTGLSCRSASWSQTKEKSGDVRIDNKLRAIRAKLDTTLDEFSSEEQINTALDAVLSGREIPKISKQGVMSFMEYFKEWSEKPSTSIRQRKLAYSNIDKLMGPADWKDIDDSYCYRLIRLMEDRGWGINYQGNMIKAVKVVMSEGAKLGYHQNYSYKGFKAPHAEVDNIYLTEDEMRRLWDAEVKSSLKSKARDLAWLGYLTCARFSDYSRLSEDNIGTDGKIRFSQQKTSRGVVLPCSPKVREILARNGGRAPVLSHQKFNQYIKELCKDCGIDDMIEVVSIKGAERERRACRKYELVTSHTFRRSAATNLYLSGVPLRSIMQLTGHTSVTMLERYLKVGMEENAGRLADNDFFK